MYQLKLVKWLFVAFLIENIMVKGLISIVMPAFNAEKYIEKAIDSILDQTYAHFELLIADDLSTDDTSLKVDKYSDPRIRILPNTEKLGYTKTCNRLFTFCLGEYIAFQDADDYSDTERLKKQLEHLHENPELMMCGTGVFIVSDKEIILDEVHRSPSYEEIIQKLPFHNQFIGSTILIKKVAFDVIGGYRSEFSRWGNQDYDWSYRVCEHFKADNLVLPLYYYRQNPASNSKKVSTLRAIGPAMVQEFGRQRKESGLDMLMNKDEAGIRDLEHDLLLPYTRDPSLIYYRHALNRIYIHQYKEAFHLCMVSISERPWLPRNYWPLFSLVMRILYRFIRNWRKSK